MFVVVVVLVEELDEYVVKYLYVVAVEEVYDLTLLLELFEYPADDDVSLDEVPHEEVLDVVANGDELVLPEGLEVVEEVELEALFGEDDLLEGALVAVREGLEVGETVGGLDQEAVHEDAVQVFPAGFDVVLVLVAQEGLHLFVPGLLVHLVHDDLCVGLAHATRLVEILALVLLGRYTFATCDVVLVHQEPRDYFLVLDPLVGNQAEETGEQLLQEDLLSERVVVVVVAHAGVVEGLDVVGEVEGQDLVDLLVEGQGVAV